jgi:serine/threonine protein kinase
VAARRVDPVVVTAIQTVGGRYALEERLGQGGMGQVYRARHLELGKVFALKVIAPAFAGDELARARFNQEAKLASGIKHPNAVPVVDFGEDPVVGAYMVMELVEGTPLLDRLRLPCSVRRAVDVLGQIADVLDHVHRRDIVHGDIKADNVLLVGEADGPRRRQVVRLIDFGLASWRGVTNVTGVHGTPEYLAPERAGGAPPTIGSDLYALGVLGFLLLAGELPFEGSTVEVLTAHVFQAPRTIAEARGEPVDPAVEALIARAMAKDPARRHPSAAAFRYEVNTIMDMLAFERRMRTSAMMKPENVRSSTICRLFDRSTMPQAAIAPDGTISVANRAFAQLLGTANAEGLDLLATALAAHVPELVRTVRSVHRRGQTEELRAHIDSDVPFDLVVWVAPFSTEAVHLLVRIEST